MRKTFVTTEPLGESDDECDDEGTPYIYVLPIVPVGIVLDEETKRDFLACNDRSDLKKLLAKLKQKILNARMKYDPAYATSPIFVTDKDYDFSVDPEIITLVESDPFCGYDFKTVVAHFTKLIDKATLLLMMRKLATTISLKYFRSH